MILVEKDAMVYKALSDAARMMRDYPGNDELARRVGYQSPKSITESLSRLENAGYIRREGNPRKPKMITILAMGKSIHVRYVGGIKVPVQPQAYFSAHLTQPQVYDGISLVDVSEFNLCRFPFGDGDFRFCGKPLKKYSSYCPEHHGLCYLPKRNSKFSEPDVRIRPDDLAFEIMDEEAK